MNDDGDVARPRSFDEAVVVDAAARCFTGLGYAATSVDDLVSATGLHRGSLYGAFGSKRGLFLAALARHAAPTAAPAGDRALDLLLVAALELAPHDEEVRAAVARSCEALGGGASSALGRRLIERARVQTGAPTDQPTDQPTDRQPHPTSRRS